MTETDPLRTLGRICEDLRELKVPFCLVGGLAVSARAEVRTTRDVDLAITVDQARLEGQSGVEPSPGPCAARDHGAPRIRSRSGSRGEAPGSAGRRFARLTATTTLSRSGTRISSLRLEPGPCSAPSKTEQNRWSAEVARRTGHGGGHSGPAYGDDKLGVGAHTCVDHDPGLSGRRPDEARPG